MAGTTNKVKYNLKNVHVAVRTAEGTYGTPFAIPGAVSMSLNAQGDKTEFYADGVKYWVDNNNNGYDGDVTMARIIDKFCTDVLGEELDDNGVLTEYGDGSSKEFAFGFEIDGDKKSNKYWMLNCTASRPNIESQTNESSKTPSTDTLSLSCAGDTVGGKRVIRYRTSDTTDETTYDNWFAQVYNPTQH